MSTIVCFLMLGAALPAQADRIMVTNANPVVLRRDPLRQQLLACYRASDGSQRLVLADDLSFRTGREINAKRLTTETSSKLALAATRNIRKAVRSTATFERLEKVRGLKSKLALYRQVGKLMNHCAGMRRQSFTSPAVPSTTYAYAMWAAVDSTHTGIVNAPRPWIYYSSDAGPTAAALAQMPAGGRVIMDMCTSQIGTQAAVSQDTRDYCTDPVTQRAFACFWWDHGVAAVKPHYQEFYSNLADAGGQLDYIALDFEAGFSNWHFNYSGDVFEAFARSVEADRRWPAVRRELTKAGIPSTASLADIFNFFDHQYYLIFNDVMQRRAAAYINQAFIQPARRHFPKVQASNFAYYNHRSQFPVREANGHPEWLGGTGWLVGGNQAPVAYGSMGGITSLKLDGQNLYAATPFNALRWNVNQIRASVLGASAATDFWYLPKTEGWSQYYESDFYQELLLHAIMSGAQRVLYWNPRNQNTPTYAGSPTYRSDKAVSDSMRELTAFTGYSDRATLVDSLQSWSDDYVLSCVAVHGSRVCRFTPAAPLRESGEAGVSIDGANVVAHTARSIVTFENARFEIGSATPQGVWITQPLSAPPPRVE